MRSLRPGQSEGLRDVAVGVEGGFTHRTLGAHDAPDVISQELLDEDGGGEEEEQSASGGVQLSNQAILPPDVVFINGNLGRNDQILSNGRGSHSG